MADYIQVPADDVGKKVDAASLDVGADTVYRQRIVIGDDSATATFAVVTSGSLQVIFASPPTINNISAVVAVSGGVAVSGTAVVAGVVGLTAGTAVIGDINAISRTVQVAVATPFTVNNISAAVTVTGLVGLTAGTAVIGDLNAISRTVQVAVGTPFTINNISATSIVAGVVALTAGTAVIGDLNAISRTVQVAIGTPFTINNISAVVAVSGGVAVSGTAVVSGNVNISATATVTGNVNISATANVVITAIKQAYAPLSVPSASRGPRMVIASTSANATLVAAPGAGMAIFVTMIAASNASGSNARGRFGTSATPGNVTMMMAGSGGGFVMQMDPPWKLSTNEALVCSIKPNVSEGIFNCHFFVASADAL